jgi:glycosyltransferase involved in cell wall biosynthesis
MNKTKCTIYAPVETYSGYGGRSRDLIRAIIQSKPDWDVTILSCRWGNTRFGYLQDHGMDDLSSRIIPQLTQQPDVFISITVPNEFQKIGKYNIGVTAGIETTLCDASWIEGCNRMDLVIVSCEHAKRVFEETKYNVQDNRTGQITGTVALQTKVEVLFEGADITKYGPLHLPTTLQLDEIDEQFAFLTIGHWLPGEVGQDRKNIGYTIKAFLETFKNKPKGKRPALVLKVQAGSGTSIMDREALLDKIDAIRKTVKGDLPNIYVVHGDLSETEVNELYNHGKIKAMISLTKGEGFGRPLLEFSLVNKPIICSGWSGQVDYLSPEFVKMIGGTLENIHPSAVVPNMLLPESKWFTPDPIQVGRALEDVYKNYSTYKELAKRQGHKSRTQFSYDKMRETVDTLLTQYIPIFPEQVPLQLPVLKRIQLPKIQ